MPESTGRYFYDLLFFVVVSVLLLNLIFGIIIDTFSSLRENANQQVADADPDPDLHLLILSLSLSLPLCLFICLSPRLSASCACVCLSLFLMQLAPTPDLP